MWDYLWSSAAPLLLGVFYCRIVGLAGGLLLDLHSLDTCKGLACAISPGMISGDRVIVSYSWFGQVFWLCTNSQRVTDIGDTTIVALAKNCLELEKLDLSYNEFVTGVGIRAFMGHKRLRVLDLQYILNPVSESDLEDPAFACPSLKSILVERETGCYVLREMRESTLLV
ncbi:hypothetical protein ACLB2K_063019 [Fragaria x ananassa]